jgi:hypothetical protein
LYVSQVSLTFLIAFAALLRLQFQARLVMRGQIIVAYERIRMRGCLLRAHEHKSI